MVKHYKLQYPKELLIAIILMFVFSVSEVDIFLRIFGITVINTRHWQQCCCSFPLLNMPMELFFDAI